MHLGATQTLLVGILAGGGLDQGCARQKGLAAAAHHDHVVRHARDIGAACGAVAMDGRDHRHPGGRELGHIEEHLTAIDEMLHLVVAQVGTTAFHQVHQRQPALQGDVLGAHRLLATGTGGRGDAAVTGHDDAAHAAHIADADDGATAGDGLVRIVLILPIACQCGQLQEGGTMIQQSSHPFPRQDLLAGIELGPCLGRGGAYPGLQHAHLGHQVQHTLPLSPVGLRGDIHCGFEWFHHFLSWHFLSWPPVVFSLVFSEDCPSP